MSYYDQNLRGGVSNLGNTAGTTGTVGGQLVFVGGANITLSESKAGAYGTVTIIGGAGAGGGGIAASAAGASVSDGTVVWSNSNNVSFGMAGSTITATATFAGGGDAIRGIAAGGSTASTSTVNFSNANGVSFGFGAAGNSTVITASHNALTSQSNQNAVASNGNFNFQTISFSNAGGVSFGTSAGSAIFGSVVTSYRASNDAVGLNTAQSNVTWTVNSSGISLDARGYAGTGTSATNASITLNSNGLAISVAAPGGGGNFSAGVSTGGNTAGDTGITGTRLVFVGSNNVTLSQATDANGGTISFNAAGGGAGQFSAGVSNLGNTAGATGITGTQNVFVGSGVVSLSQTTGANGGTISILAPATSSLSGTGGISLSTNGSTISIGYAAFTKSRFNPFMEAVGVAGQLGQASLHLHPVPDPENFQFDRVAFDVVLSNATNSTGSVTASFWVGFYTRNVATLSLLASSSTSQGLTYSGTVNNSTFAGPRLLTLGWTTTITQNDYWLGIVSRTTTDGTNASFSQYLASDVNSNFSGVIGAASAATLQNVLGLGFYTATTSGMPGSIGFSQINGSASQAQRVPLYYFLSQTV
jgi:hypothetical protein